MIQKCTTMGSVWAVRILFILVMEVFRPLKKMALRAITSHKLEGRDSSVGTLIPASHRHQPQIKSCWVTVGQCIQGVSHIRINEFPMTAVPFSSSNPKAFSEQ